jgi:hypothetical protein
MRVLPEKSMGKAYTQRLGAATQKRRIKGYEMYGFGKKRLPQYGAPTSELCEVT